MEIRVGYTNTFWVDDLHPDEKILVKDFCRKGKTGIQIKPIEYRRINLPCFDAVGYKTKISSNLEASRK